MARRAKKQEIQEEKKPAPEAAEAAEADGRKRKPTGWFIRHCPFCGGPGKIKVIDKNFPDLFVCVKCRICGAQGKGVFINNNAPQKEQFELRDLILHAWNMRSKKDPLADPDEDPEEDEELDPDEEAED